MTQTSADFNLRYVLRALRRRLPIFLLCLVLVPAAAVAISALQKKQYTATASLLFRDPQFDQKLFGSTFVQTQLDPARQAATNLELVALQRVAARTAASLHGVSEDQVSSAVTVSSAGQSDLVSIAATEGSPGFAAKLANTYATEYIAFRRDADRAKIVSAQAPLQRRIASLRPPQRSGALGQSLQQRLGQLSVLASLQTGNAELVQPAEVPRGASSPKPVRNGALGVFLGILLGIALVVVAEALDRRLRDPAEVEQIFERPLLAALPESAALTRPDPPMLRVPQAEREAFRMLRVNLRYFSLSRDVSSVLITSADRDEGKSTVAWGLAVAAANAGSRTLIIEADLRNPSFASRFELPSRDGLTSVLAGDADRTQATIRVPLPLTEGDESPARSMDVLLAGPRPPDPTDLLQSRPMAEFLRELEKQYDLIVIDTPPATIVSDAIPLIPLASGVIVVSRLGKAVRDHARRLRQQLDHLDAAILGVVVNSVRGAEPYGYGYGYGEPSSALAQGSNGAGPRPKKRQPANAVSPSGFGAQEPAHGTAPAQEGAPPHQESLERNGVSRPLVPTRGRRLRDWLR